MIYNYICPTNRYEKSDYSNLIRKLESEFKFESKFDYNTKFLFISDFKGSRFGLDYPNPFTPLVIRRRNTWIFFSPLRRITKN